MDHIKRICKGYLISLVLFGLFSFLGALLLLLTPFPESGEFFYLLAGMTAVSFFIGLYMSGWFQKAGLLVGALFAALLVFLILTLTALSFSSFFSLSMLRPIYAVPIGAGAVGGILGANLKK